MPRDESLQHKLDRVRPPRVQITYDVEIGGAQVKKELPFVLGVLADLAGHPDPDAPPLPELKDEKRKFVEINRDSFDRVMKGIKPRLALRVDNAIQGDGTKLGVELKFDSIEDFEPVRVVEQVEPLRKLLEARRKLAELKSKVVTNDRLESLLQRIIHDADQLSRLSRETGGDAPAASQEETRS
ncbi:type VI secretion system contractile sheath small subunit [Paludisphaera mucosa]|uniref:Type VI secretion system contractile sheath small subunit n=1 Tax=Paludisphaera mucosa TaxID=3030827 RepID=A0ABT6FDY1_9BACT|nr:type VI secretion system contractile sheath small subunit [Paludisphaera mucosa]MDG3005784.1 type VI secretion system contractile sheath small subunit [Paludisphaera mucosa]